jgi:hypothetical protein
MMAEVSINCFPLCQDGIVSYSTKEVCS